MQLWLSGSIFFHAHQFEKYMDKQRAWAAKKTQGVPVTDPEPTLPHYNRSEYVKKSIKAKAALAKSSQEPQKKKIKKWGQQWTCKKGLKWSGFSKISWNLLIFETCLR